MNCNSSVSKYEKLEKYYIQTFDYVKLSRFFAKTKDINEYYDVILKHKHNLHLESISKNKYANEKILAVCANSSVNITRELLIKVKDKRIYNILKKLTTYIKQRVFHTVFNQKYLNKNILISIFYNAMISSQWEYAALYYKLSDEIVLRFYKKLKIKNLRRNRHINKLLLDKLEIFL